MKLTRIIFFIIFICASASARAQDRTFSWEGTANALAGTGEYLPFWARTGNDGIYPYSTSGALTLGADVGYGKKEGWSFEAGTNFIGAVAAGTPAPQRRAYAIVDRLYLSGSWKMLHMDIGMKPRARELEDISVSGGNVVYSRNARNIPGVNAWSDWIYFEKGHWFGVKGNVAHYQMIDNRFVKGTMLHNKSVAAKLALGPKVDLSAGFEHWAQWGGESPIYGKQPTTFMDFWRVLTAGKGGEGATESDRINVLGNHLGREYIRLDWRAEDFTLTAQYDKPFEDGSGMKLRNVPDGIWSLQCSFNDREAWITDVIYEFISTTWQSGPEHNTPDGTILGGCDNYFANGEYKSGWTNYNRVMGCPLLLPALPGRDGITTDMASTRVRACHVGLKGLAFNKMPYKFLATYSRNFGKYHQGPDSFFASEPQQLSLALEVGLSKSSFDLPLGIAVGVYGDIGELYQNSAGLTLKFIFGNSKELL